MPSERHNEQKIAETLEKNYMPYAMSVIVSRAIPEIDGLKPSHRKLLYTMYLMKLLNGPRTKSANVVGQTMKLNPHGDAAIYETMVRMTRGNEALLLPFLDSKGNFGKQYSRDMRYAAARYTEVKLDKICDEMFADLDKDTVDFVENYDGTMREPTLLPVTFPNILVNPNKGIAVGMASSICSFNLEEVCRASIAYINDPDVNLSDYIKGPDFSTGGYCLNRKQDLEAVLATGRGNFTVRSKYKFDPKNSCIEITEIPYTTYVEDIIDDIVNLVKDNKIKDITDIRDETDIDGLKITIDVKKNTDHAQLMKKLYKLTTLQDIFSCNFNILINGKPQVMGVKQIIHEWLEFRMGCIRKQTAFDIARKSEKLHLLYGLKKILLDIDKAIAIIRNTEHDSDVVPNLMGGFDIDKLQADYIAEIKLRNLNKEYILNRLSETDDLEKEIAALNSLLESPRKIRNVIVKQLEQMIKKYSSPRKTQLIDEDDDDGSDDGQLFIEDFNVRCFLTRESYFKKIPLASLRSNPEQKLKEGDEITGVIDTRNKSDMLFFSNKCSVYKMKTHDIGESKASVMGEYLPNLLGLEPGETIMSIMATDDYKGHVLFSYENGKIAKIRLDSYATKTNRKKLINAYYGGSKLADIKFLSEDIDLIASSDKKKALAFNTSMINEKSTKDSCGVQVMTVKKGSRMASVKRLNEVKLQNPDYYRTKTIPAVGHFLRPEDDVSGYVQITLELPPPEPPAPQETETDARTPDNGEE